MARQTALSPSLRERLAALPDQPGVYLFKDAAGTVLYVGKALSLRARVRSYFQRPDSLAPRIRQLVGRIADVETQPVSSEAEALLRESELIKQLHPKYNVAFRDDKSYPLLKLTDEPFPRLRLVREKTRGAAPKPPLAKGGPASPRLRRGLSEARRAKEGGGSPSTGLGAGRYFGPYADAALLHQAVQFLRRVFPLRTCRTFPKTPCLEYHLGQCLAPCAGYIKEAAYRRMTDDLVAFLEGKRDDLLRDLSRRMQQASRDQRYEEAARLRDQIEALTSVIVAKEKSAFTGPLEQLQLALKLPAVPARIEAFDISNLYGTYAVGSMVTFVGGKPHKAHYRHFKIKTVSGIDDYQMMAEVIRRRYGGSLAQELPTPDLILVDGGKGQLSAAVEALRSLGLAIPTVGLAKRFEEIFVMGQADPIVLLPTSPVLKLVQHIRNEAHRFAIAYHRKLRTKGVFR